MEKAAENSAVRASSSTPPSSPMLRRRARRPHRAPHMTPDERSRLTWLAKWRDFGRRPWKLIVHAALVLLATGSVVAFTTTTAPYRKNSRMTFNYIFVPEFVRSGFDAALGQYYLYTTEEVKECMRHAASTYFTFVNQSVDRYYYTDPAGTGVITRVWERYVAGARIFSPSNRNFRTVRTTDQVRTVEAALYPFNLTNEAALRDVVDSTYLLSLNFELRGADVLSTNLLVSYHWYIAMRFDFSVRGGRVALAITTDLQAALFEGSYSAEQLARFFFLQFFWVDVLLVFFATVSAVLSARSLLNNFYYRRPRLAALVSPEVWRALNPWHVVSFVGALCMITSSVLNVMRKAGVIRGSLAVQVFLGLSAALAWFNILRYLESFAGYYVLILALRRGMPNVTRLVISAMPILIGYTLFGMVCFSELSDNFDTFDHSFAALFSTVNGDNLYSRFITIADHPRFTLLARVFEYSFTCIACYAVINIFIAIIQESYTSTRDALLVTRDADARDAAGRGRDGGDADAAGGGGGGGALLPRLELENPARDASTRAFRFGESAEPAEADAAAGGGGGRASLRDTGGSGPAQARAQLRSLRQQLAAIVRQMDELEGGLLSQRGVSGPETETERWP